jgi:hypothetical protein
MSPEVRSMAEPMLLQIKTGWLAVSQQERWAAEGKTKEEAVNRFRKAEQKHREVDSRPYVYERQDGNR